MTSDRFKNKEFNFFYFKRRLIYGCLLITAYCLLFLSLSCGKKGLPTLKAYEKPQPPAGLSAVRREDKIILSWSYPENLRSAIKGFYILKAEADGFEKVAFADSSAGLFVDTDFRLNAAYRYKVTAQNLKGVQSPDSNIIAVMPQPVPPPPDNIRFVVKGDLIEISWSSSGRDACYNIYRTTEKGKYSDSPRNKTPECMTSYKDVANPDMPVYYVIRALLNTGIRDEGYASAELEINPVHFTPSPPSDLRIVAGEGRIYLVWKESPEPWVRGYRVYRKTEGESEFRLIGDAKTPAFTDTDKNYKKAWYMIKALGPAAESEPLVGEISIVTPIF